MDTRDFEKEFMQGTEEAPPASAVTAPVAEPEPPAPATLRDFEAEFMGQTPRSQRPVGTAGTQAPPREKPASDQAKPSMRMTRTMVARRPPTTPERDLTLGEALTQAKSNLLPSIGGVFSSFKEAVTNPLETAEGVAALGKGALSKTAGAIGLQQDQAKAAEDQKVLNAILDQYKQTYGSEQGFLRALAKDPATIMADLSMIMSGGATGVAKLAGTGSTAAKIASKVAAVAPNLDPIQASINLAKGASMATGATRRLVSSGLTGVPVSSLELVQKIGEAGTPEQRSIFQRVKTGDMPQGEIIDIAEDALKKAREKRANDYQVAMANRPQRSVDFTEAGRELGRLRDEFTIDLGNGQRIPRNREALDIINRIENEVLAPIATTPAGSVGRNIFNADAAKQSIGELRSIARSSPQAHYAATQLYNKVRDAIVKADPSYARVMKEYEDLSDFLEQTKMTFGVTKKLPDATILKRLVKSDNPMAQELLSRLGDFRPELPAAIAGAAVSEWFPQGSRNVLLNSLPFLTGAATGPIGGAIHYGAQLASASPRVAGEIAYKAGQLQRVTKPIGRALTYKNVAPVEVAGRVREEMIGGEPGSPEEETTQDMSSDTFDRMLDAESGNSQFDERGNTILGPEVKTGFGIQQAVGAAQVLPTTGPEAAEAAGLEWDENRFRNDMEYNVALGRAYFEKQLQAFGDPRKAAAAYNAGPERVRQAMRKAEQEGGSFEDYLPSETKNYLVKVFGAATGGRIERRSGGRVDNVETLVSQLMTRVKGAKRETQKMTEPLLNQPDEHIVKALDVAQRAI